MAIQTIVVEEDTLSITFKDGYSVYMAAEELKKMINKHMGEEIKHGGKTYVFGDFQSWLENLRRIAYEWNSTQYPLGSKWDENFWKEKYFDKGFTPADAWADYTTMVK